MFASQLITGMMLFDFLRLPSEIRNQIYSLLLIQPHPIELWPTNEVAFAEGFDIIPEDDATPEYSAKCVRTSFDDLRTNSVVAILRVSRTTHQEAAPIFYGKNEFRFSMDLGWMPMFHFLFTIGKENRKMLRKLAVFPPIMELSIWDRFISPAPPLSVFEETRFNIPAEHLTLDYSEIITKCVSFLVEAQSLRTLYLVLPPGLIYESSVLETGLYPGFCILVESDAASAEFRADIILVLAHETYHRNSDIAYCAETCLLWETRVKSANDWRYAQAVMADEDEDTTT